MSGDALGIVVGGCRIEAELGRGGAGTVYRATQLGIGRRVAVKLIPRGADGDEGAEAVSRFEREAHAAGALDHSHCLPVYAAGEQDGLLYLVMRLVDGPDLALLIQARGPLRPRDAIDLIEQVAAAVDYAHAAGLVHRDLKPANILIEADERGGVGHAWVSDFGLMRSLTDPGITQSGQWVGTPRFAAPEQMRGDEVGPAADIYALGGVLAAALGPDPGPELEAVISRALSPDPADRFADAHSLARAARVALDGGIASATRTEGPGAADAWVSDDRSASPVDATAVAPTAGARTRRGPNTDPPTWVASPDARRTPRRDRSWRAGGRRILAGTLALVLAAGLAAIAVAVVLAVSPGSSRSRDGGGAGERTGTAAATTGTAPSRTVSRPATTTSVGDENQLRTAAFTAVLPANWTTATDSEQLQGYERTVVQNPNGSAEAFIDRSALPEGTLLARAQGVEAATRRTTPGYRQVSFGTTTTAAGATEVVWSFSLANESFPQRVDVFREVGGQLYAVLGSSNSLSVSESTATGIASSIVPR